MTFDVAKLPRNATECVIKYMDNNSLLRIREVAKPFKNMLLLPSTKKIAFRHLELYDQEKDDETTITILYEKNYPSSFDYYFFKNYFMHTMSKLNIRKYFCVNNTKRLEATMTSTELTQFLASMKSLFQINGIRSLTLTIYSSELIHALSHFLEGVIIPEVYFYLWPSECDDLNPYLRIAQQVKPKYVQFNASRLHKNVVDFVLHLADLVETIRFLYDESITPEPLSSSCQIIEGILSRKCKNLEIFGSSRQYCISLDDIEKIFQFLHHSQKKLLLSRYVSYEQIDCQVGEYHVFSNENKLLIEHSSNIELRL